MKLTKDKNETIRSSLWIIASFIIFFNGLGFIYIGSKTRNEKWIREGCIYELPWFLLILEAGLVNNSLGAYIAVIGLISVLISIIRSVMVNPEYQEALNNNSYRKSKSKINSLLFFVFSAIPIINGIPMIVYGFSNSNRNRILEGIIYEVPWALLFIFNSNESLSNFLAMIGLFLTLVSIIRSIRVNYETGSLCENVFHENTSEKSMEDPIMREPPITENIVENESENEESPYKDKLPEINDLSNEFKTKESRVSQLIEKRFKTSELTYNKFKAVVASAHENFYIQRDSALEIIDLSSHKNEKLDSELAKRIEAMKSILAKIEQLIEALVIDSKESKESEEDLKVLVEDMEELIDSVKDYN